jgi:alanyl-tRNA synthetase
MTTERLYYTDAYLTRFTARVTGREDGGRRIYLDRSAFYPTSGGQPHDRGTLGGVAVADVVDEGDRVAHLLAAPLEATAVDAEVDWARRFDHMQQHTGQHVLSAVFADLFGYETVSVHFGPDYATLDLGVETVSAERLVAAERRANEVVTGNRPVQVSFEDAASAAGLRKVVAREGTLRIVTIDRLDRSACGGTHVRATGEIGPILLRRQEKMKKHSRVEFRCGMRAVQRARADFDVLTRLAVAASASVDELATLVPAQVAQLKAAEGARRRLEEELAGFRARALWEGLGADDAGVRWLVEHRTDGRADDVRALAIAFAALPRAVYAATFDEAKAILVAASDDSGVDAGQRLKAALAAAGGRGGGSPRLAQGSVPDAGALPGVLDAVRAGA